MGVEEFAKYVRDNIGRATLVNSFNIIEKLDTQDGYPFVDFVNSILKCLEVKNLADMRIAVSAHTALERYADSIYNKQMVIDNFILDMWEAVNGVK